MEEEWISKDVLIRRIMTKAQLKGIQNTYSFSKLDNEIAKYKKRLVKKSKDDDETWGDNDSDNVYEYCLA